jgi:hypothetical protein
VSLVRHLPRLITMPTPDPVLNAIIFCIALDGLAGVYVLVREFIKWLRRNQ